jgi:small subunit ribosomal protein S6
MTIGYPPCSRSGAPAGGGCSATQVVDFWRVPKAFGKNPKGGVRMNIYENIIILNASPTDEELEASLRKIKDLIVSSGGEILKADVWGRRKLANEIKKQKKGFYVLLAFRSASSLIRKLEDYYKVFDPVIKYVVIKLEKKQSAHLLASLQAEAARAEKSAAAAVATEQKKEE